MTLLSIILSIIVSAQIDSTELWMGDQVQLKLQSVQPQEAVVEFPIYGETLIPEIEIVSRTHKDTVFNNDGTIAVSQALTITSFKDSLFYIEPLPFVSNGDTFFTEAIALNVIQPFEIDTTNAITDIKPIYKAPIWWRGIIGWTLICLGIIGIGVGIYFLVRYLQKHPKAGKEAEINLELLRPAEEVALEKLNKVKEEKIWQQGRTKDYYTELTDIVREYIARRFNITAEEKTSAEILQEIKPLLTDKELFTRLGNLLRLADLVKFAKWTTQPDENEISLRSAYIFVEQTTPIEEPTKETE